MCIYQRPEQLQAVFSRAKRVEDRQQEPHRDPGEVVEDGPPVADSTAHTACE